MTCFLIKYDELLEKCDTIWDKVSADIKKELDSEPVYNKKLLKTKIKSYGDKVTDYYKEIPKVDSNHTCLAVVSFCLQAFLTECKYIEKKGIRHINYNLSDFSQFDESDQE